MPAPAAPHEIPSDQWCTPAWVLDLVRRLGPIELDPCGNARSIVGARREFRLERGEDGLARRWGGGAGLLVFTNPPYSRGNLGRWMAKCREEAADGAEVIALVPADTSTRWWHEEVRRAAAFSLLKRRVRFLGAVNGSPKFGSALVYWGPRPEAFREAMRSDGWVFLSRRAGK